MLLMTEIEEDEQMAKIVAWVIVVALIFVVLKIVFGLLAALIPLLGGVIIGFPIGWIAKAISNDVK